ncbi:hypothetical protein ACFRKB_34490 [Streptomyces scopuliridis]|uniref:hypothetical protein n=1 Tax=Streptomyces scopuliridis TaxID=452529 RepID=UPI0036B8C6CF
MRPLRRRTSALTTAALLTTGLAVSLTGVPSAGAAASRGDPDDRFHASCRTAIVGSRATASCHNPYPQTDRIRLHVECARWWDIDADSAPVDVGPAGYAELTDRCWKEIREVWVTHERP